MRVNKVSYIFIAAIIMLLSFSLVLAEGDINVSVNGNIIEFDNPPVIKDGRTLVPLRQIFEALNVDIEWDNNTKTVRAYYDNNIVSIPLNSTTAFIFRSDGTEEKITLDVPAQLINSSTFVPVRFIGESLGSKVNWNNETKTVEVTKEIKQGSTQRLDYEDGYYEGEVTDGNINGYGKYVYKTGEIAEGNWVNGELNGKGKYTYANGTIYEGNFNYGVQNGNGCKVTFNNGDIFEGVFVNGKLGSGIYTYANGNMAMLDENGEVITEESLKGKRENQDKEENADVSEFRKQAYNGASYNELLKNSTNYIDTPTYFSGEIIQALEDEDGNSIFLMDTSSFANAFADMTNQYGDINQPIMEHVEAQIVVIYSDKSVDILADDEIDAYGKVMEKVSYVDELGITHTVPAIKLIEFDRKSYRSDEVIEMMFRKK